MSDGPAEHEAPSAFAGASAAPGAHPKRWNELPPSVVRPSGRQLNNTANTATIAVQWLGVRARQKNAVEEIAETWDELAAHRAALIPREQRHKRHRDRSRRGIIEPHDAALRAPTASCPGRQNKGWGPTRDPSPRARRPAPRATIPIGVAPAMFHRKGELISGADTLCMRSWTSHSRFFVTMRSDEARRGSLVAEVIGLHEIGGGPSASARLQPAQTTTRRRTTSGKLQTKELSSRVSFAKEFRSARRTNPSGMPSERRITCHARADRAS